MSAYGFTTRILHGDRSRPIEHGAVHKPIHTSVPFAYPDSRTLARVFQGDQAGFSYARNSQPTAEALEAKVTAMEQGLAPHSRRMRHTVSLWAPKLWRCGSSARVRTRSLSLPTSK